MIKNLLIKNFILIDEIKLDFENCFNVICGETGAGKSILIKAIDVVLGARANKELIKVGANSALIEATFSAQGIEIEGELLEPEIIISREIGQSSSKFRVNGALVNLEYVKNLGEKLIDIHSQHQTYAYLRKNFHINLLDEFICANHFSFKEELNKFEKDFLQLKQIKEKIDKIEKNNEENLNKIDFLKFQIDEIERAEIYDDEEDKLNEELEVLSNITTLKETTYGAYWALGGEDTSINDALSKIQMLVSRATSMDKNLNAVEESFIEGFENLKFCAAELRNYCENLSDNPIRLDEINERLSLIEKLKRKYGNINEALDKFQKELNEIEVDVNELANLKIKAEELEIITENSAQKLAQSREEHSKILSEKVTFELKKLELEKASFEVAINSVPMNKKGVCDVEFLITTNVSQKPASLNKVASGGELSRVMLAIKTVFLNTDSVNTMIFDEIDTGISGKTSQAVASAIFELSKSIQIFAITHQPIIASKAGAIYWVEKTQMENSVSISVSKLVESEIPNALAQMASGEVSQTSLTFVKNLINS